MSSHVALSLLGRLEVQKVCVGVPVWDPVLGFYAYVEQGFEGCVEAGSIMCEEVTESAGPVAQFLHAYFA